MKKSTDMLDAALARLETALDSLLDKSGDPTATAREVEVLNIDRAKLADELDAALARERELQELADEASEALGSAIAEVRAALLRQEEEQENVEG